MHDEEGRRGWDAGLVLRTSLVWGRLALWSRVEWRGSRRRAMRSQPLLHPLGLEALSLLFYPFYFSRTQTFFLTIYLKACSVSHLFRNHSLPRGPGLLHAACRGTRAWLSVFSCHLMLEPITEAPLVSSSCLLVSELRRQPSPLLYN